MAEKKVYVKIANTKNTRGVRYGKWFFNNQSVFEFEEGNIPAAIKAGLNQRLLTKATKKEYDVRAKQLEEAAAYGKKVAKARKLAKARRLGLIEGEEVQELTKEVKEKKKTTKKATKPKADAKAEDKK